jgi:hypothetical protein
VRHTILSGIVAAVLSCSLANPAEIRPSAEEQASMLAAMGRYAEKYVSNLPNFLCMQVTAQWEADRKGAHWHKGDTLTSRLAFSDGHERRTLELVNNKPIHAAQRRWKTPLVTEGEFGELMEMVFADSSDASFNWNRWDTIRGNRVAVFDFSVVKEHSGLKLSDSDLVSAIVPFQGSVYADPKSGVVLRISQLAPDVPPELQTREIGTTVDYGEIAIGSATYVLPVHATVLLKKERRQIRNELDFKDYRKFEAESSIKFDADQPRP